MKQDDKFFIWNKGENPQLSKNFYGAEFDCKCHNEDCVEQKISKELIEKLQAIRNEIKSSVEVNSGFRCAKHQQDLVKRGVNTVVAKKSSHEEGIAADICAPSIVHAEFYKKYVEPKFNNLGRARNFTHVDMRPLKANGQKRYWNY